MGPVSVVPVRVHVRRRCCVSWPITLVQKDTVLKEVPEEWVKAQGLLEVRSEISDKNLYLTRPDMGRRLCAEAVEALKARCCRSGRTGRYF